MKDICIKIMKNGKTHLFTLNVVIKPEVTGRIVIEYSDPMGYDICLPERTKYIVFTDPEFNLLDTNAVAWKIVGHLQEYHPSYKFDVDYSNVTYGGSEGRIIIKCYKTFKEEKKQMKDLANAEIRPLFNKVIINGPATIGFINDYNHNHPRKFIIKKADGDAYDPEKAMLMLVCKSQFSSDEEFHKWFKVNMKQFRKAYIEGHPDVGGLQWNRVDAASISKGINDSIDRMSQRMHEYAERINKRYTEFAEKKDSSRDTCKKGKTWEEHEIEFLRRRYGVASMSKIAMVLGRSEAAVKSKAHRLGLDKKED